MADALVSLVLEQLSSLGRELQEELKLVKGVEKEIQKLKMEFTGIMAVLDDAEKRRIEDVDVHIWVDRLKQVCYDMEDVLDEWTTATILKQQLQPAKSASRLKRISSHLPWIRRPVWKHKMARKIKDISQRLDEVVNQKDRYNFKSTRGTTATELERIETTSFVDVSHIHGRQHVKNILIDRLLSERSQEERNHPITAIVGMGGIGKTTLAQLAYNDENVKEHFKKRIWVCVSDPFKVTNIARVIIKALGSEDRNLTDLESMLQEISKGIENQKFLLILDDVWNGDYKKWEPLRNCLKNGAQGSKVLVTTRSEKVASIMEAADPIPLKKLSTEVCWSIFSQIAFFERSEEECKVLEEIGKKISKRCKGLPLAAKVLGGLMRFKRSGVEWQNVLDSDLWELEEANKELDPVFMLSYYDLPSPMKHCFTYCATFPEDHVITRDFLIQLWMANGFLKGREMEITGEDYFESLAMRSLFQDLYRDPRSGRIVECKMHDLVREFALRVSRNECGAIEVYKDEEEGLMMKQEQELLGYYAKLRHARLRFKGGDLSSSSGLSKFRMDGLRTLWITELIIDREVETNILRGLFCGLTSLRALELKGSNIEELPVEIGKLMHLRYLGLERNRRLEALPETVCDLFNLQTLNLQFCSRIERLPRGIGKLLNLRRLEFDGTGITKLPKGIGELASLRTLSDFVCSNNNREKEEEYFGIGDFEKLNHIGGKLRLRYLGNLELSDVGEAKRARLKNKKNLQALYLYFSRTPSAYHVAEEETEEERAKRHLVIAEALLEEDAPPPHLEILYFSDYKGTELPSWFTSLSGLKFLELCHCPKLKELPETVCDLFNLQTLNLQFCSGIKTLPRGIGKLLNLRHLAFELAGITKLPKGIGKLTSLRTLLGAVVCSNNNRETEEEYFGIGDLEKLNHLGGELHLKWLRDLELSDVGEAKRARLKNKRNLRTLKLDFSRTPSDYHVAEEEEEEEERAKRMHLLIAEALLEEEAPTPRLEILEIRYYRGTELPSWITSLSGLIFLELSDCPNLQELPGDFFEGLPPLLERVRINGCPTLAQDCRRRMTENTALAPLFRID